MWDEVLLLFCSIPKSIFYAFVVLRWATVAFWASCFFLCFWKIKWVNEVKQSLLDYIITTIYKETTFKEIKWNQNEWTVQPKFWICFGHKFWIDEIIIRSRQKCIHVQCMWALFANYMQNVRYKSLFLFLLHLFMHHYKLSFTLVT